MADVAFVLNKRKQFSLGLLLLFIIVLIIWLLIFPTANSILESKETLTKQEKSIASIENKLQALQKIIVNGQYLENKEQVNLALIDHKPLLELLAGLDQVARASEVTLANLELNPGGLSTDSAAVSKNMQKEGVDSLAVAFKIDGSFEQVTHFMELLEKIAPFTTIESFSVSEGKGKETTKDATAAAQASESQDKVSVSLSCQTYFTNVTAKTALSTVIPVLSDQELSVLAKIKEFQATNLPEQKEITGGGLEDLFGLPKIDEIYSNKN